jgi:glutamate-1-semialdehyde 2,1-aminomutase
VFHAGTLAGNPMATAAGLAALGQLDAAAYEEIERRATRLVSIIDGAASRAGSSIRTTRVGTLVGLYLGDGLPQGRTPKDFDEAKTTDEKLYARVFHALLGAGVAMAPGAYEALFVGLSHDDSVLDELERRFDVALSSLD